MKMDTDQGINLQISLQELIDAFHQLPPSQADDHSRPYPVKFTLTDGYGHPCERQLLFHWNAEQAQWVLNTKGYDLLVTYSGSSSDPQ